MAEIDGMVLETAGSLLGPLAALVGGANVVNVFKPIITELINKLVSSNFCMYNQQVKTYFHPYL